MWKYILYLLIIFCVYSSAFSQTVLKGFIEKKWTIDTARQEAFLNLETTKDLKMYDLIDPNLIENKQAINKNQYRISNRDLTIFDDGYYAVRILEDDLFDKGFLYNSSGKLINVYFEFYPTEIKTYNNLRKFNSKLLYPHKIYCYSYPDGYLIFVSIIINKYNSYEFLPDGTLNAHWVGNKGYDVNGKVFMTRK